MENGRQFNIRDEDGRNLCPACGFPGYFDERSYGNRGGVIATGICPCCQWEPGFDDSPTASGAPATILEALRQFRRRWPSDGLTWSGQPDQMPSEWDGRAQLDHLFRVAPYVR